LKRGYSPLEKNNTRVVRGERDTRRDWGEGVSGTEEFAKDTKGNYQVYWKKEELRRFTKGLRRLCLLK